jgi:glucokinase
MTNRDWIISSDELQRKFKLKSCSLLNDWEAIAYCLPSLKNEDLHVIREGKVMALDHGPKLIIGPGTGLGAALYSQINNFEYVNSTEIGNTQTSIQYYLNIFGINDSDSFTILEDVLSGSGLTKIYKHLEGEEISTEEILSRLNKNNDSICAEIIDNYIKCFAVLCSEMALTYNCTGGIFLAGGLMREIKDYFDNDIFNQHFISIRKQAHKNFLENIPVFLVKKQFTPLYGNLNYFLKRS